MVSNLALLYYDFTMVYLDLIEEDITVKNRLESYIAHRLKECIKYYKCCLNKLENERENDMNERDLLNKKNAFYIK